MITSEQAAAIARERAQAQGWGLVEPLAVLRHRTWFGKVRSYTIESNPFKPETQARFEIDARTGAVLSEGFVGR